MNFIEVSEKHFFQAVGGPENINPTAWPDYSEWKNLRSHAVVGRSEPGYKGSYGKPHRYWLEESFAGRKPCREPAHAQAELFAA